MRLFGTSGVRGTVDSKLHPDVVARLGVAIGNFFGPESEIVVASDHRYPSYPVKMGVVSGLLSAGVDVIDLGEFPTPGVLHYLKMSGLDGAVIVTGSHTPPQITGILVFTSDTSELTREEERRVEELFNEGARLVRWDSLGLYERVEEGDAIDAYIDSVLSYVKLSRIEGRKVVFDAGCGAMAGVADKVLEAAGVKHVVINNHRDPEFSCRSPYPTPENLKDMGRVAAAIGADLSVGTDGDGDRAIFGDECGTVYWGDVSGALIVRRLAEKGEKDFVITINTSSVAVMLAERSGAKVHFCRVGPPAIAEAMKKSGAFFGFEESGKFLWADAIYYSDSILATFRMLELLDEEGRTLSELAAELPKTYMVKEIYDCPDEAKPKVLELARRKVSERIPEEEIRSVMTIDGVKFFLKDYSWILLRPSGTEPVFRMFVEAFDEKRFKELVEIGREAVKQALKEVLG